MTDTLWYEDFSIWTKVSAAKFAVVDTYAIHSAIKAGTQFTFGRFAAVNVFADVAVTTGTIAMAYSDGGSQAATQSAVCGAAGILTGIGVGALVALPTSGTGAPFAYFGGRLVGEKACDLAYDWAVDKDNNDPSKSVAGYSADQAAILDSWDPRKQQAPGAETKIDDNSEDSKFVAENQDDQSDLADNPTQEGGQSEPLSNTPSAESTTREITQEDLDMYGIDSRRTKPTVQPDQVSEETPPPIKAPFAGALYDFLKYPLSKAA